MRFAAFYLIVLLLDTCSHSKALHPIELNREFQLKFHEMALLKSEKTAIRFSSVIQDSRCPKDVQCIAAGKAVIELELRKQKEQLSAVQLTTEAGTNEISWDKYKIKLLDVTPYPVSAGEKDITQYTVKLIVSEF